MLRIWWLLRWMLLLLLLLLGLLRLLRLLGLRWRIVVLPRRRRCSRCLHPVCIVIWWSDSWSVRRLRGASRWRWHRSRRYRRIRLLNRSRGLLWRHRIRWLSHMLLRGSRTGWRSGNRRWRRVSRSWSLLRHCHLLLLLLLLRRRRLLLRHRLRLRLRWRGNIRMLSQRRCGLWALFLPVSTAFILALL